MAAVENIVQHPLKPAIGLAALLISLTCFGNGSAGRAKLENLALNKPAACSSIENQEHNAAAANDGDPDTSWRADDEPEGVPDWWQVDLQKPADLSGCQIRWPFDGMKYRFRVEGSADGKTWSMLSDQTKSVDTHQVRRLTFQDAKGIRFMKITITAFDDGCQAAISEVKVFGKPE